MDLIVNDQSPIFFVKDVEMLKAIIFGFFMRVAMGLALREEDRNGKAVEFYNLLSSFT